MAKLTIITQNLDGKITGSIRTSNGWEDSDDSEISAEIISKYKDASVKVDYKVDIYAVQELKKYNKETNGWPSITKTLVINNDFQKDASVSGRAEEIWDKAFPWTKFVSGYWDECGIIFAGHKIKIINFHSSPTYNLGIRYTLLKRLSEIPRDRLIILLGDFNAAFEHQTGTLIPENEKFLKEITEGYGFIECTDKKEDDGDPHCTRLDRKLDHIFISESLFKRLRDSDLNEDKERPYVIEYIDEVNLNTPVQTNKISSEEIKIKPFTDHSGIKLTIELPDPKADSGQAEASAP